MVGGYNEGWRLYCHVTELGMRWFRTEIGRTVNTSEGVEYLDAI